MEIPASQTSACLPLSRRLRRAVLVALLLGLWAPCKIVWEQKIAREQDALRYHGVAMTRQLRDQLSQGMTMAVLSGMRNVVADLVWLNVTPAWMEQQWFKIAGYINLATMLQPRAPLFWDMGGWELAWNASVDALGNPRSNPDLRQIKASRFWIELYGGQPDCWGIFLWSLSDCWPQISPAYIAYPFNPKPSLIAVKEAYARINR